MRQQLKRVTDVMPASLIPARWAGRRRLLTALAITALLGGCAFYGEITSISDMPRSGPPSMRGACNPPPPDYRPPPCYR